MVVAIDDAVGLVLFSASFGIANALEQGRIDPISILLEPLVEIVLSLGLGALAGLLLNQLEIHEPVGGLCAADGGPFHGQL